MFRNLLIFSLIGFTLSACGGGGGTGSNIGTQPVSGSGQIDINSPSAALDLQAQLSVVDPSVRVTSQNDGTLVFTRGSERFSFRPGNTAATVFELHGTLYGVTIDPSGHYTYAPYSSATSLIQYNPVKQRIVEDLQTVQRRLGVEAANNLVDLTQGRPNTAAAAAPNRITLDGTGSVQFDTLGGNIDISGALQSSQSLTIDHNFVDYTVRQAHAQGWDGTGVNVTILDFGQQRYVDTIEIEQTLDGTIEYFNDGSLQTTSIAEVSTVEFPLSHSDVVSGFAVGLDWERKLLGQFNLALDNNCEGSKQSLFSSGTYTVSGTLDLNTNYCNKFGVATGANGSVDSVYDTDWHELIEAKNNSGTLEIVNFSFGSSNNSALYFRDNHNVVIVNSAGNESEENNGYDIYADGRSPSDTYDPYETMELAIIDSDFADNLIAVGALDSNGQIAVYSTIAGPDYDGSSYAFLVDDGTVLIDFNSITKMTGDISVNEGNSVYNGTFNGTLTETFTFDRVGTSIAGPRITGKVAIASQKFPNLNAEQLVNLAKYTATDMGARGVDPIYGHGKVNLTGMLSPVGQLR